MKTNFKGTGGEVGAPTRRGDGEGPQAPIHHHARSEEWYWFGGRLRPDFHAGGGDPEPDAYTELLLDFH